MKKHIWKKILGISCLLISVPLWVVFSNADPFMSEHKNIVLQLLFNCGWGYGLATILSIAGFVLTFGVEWLIKLISLINQGKPARKR